MPEEWTVDADRVLQALEAGEFDGVSHTYEPYSGYGKESYQVSMSVSGGCIEGGVQWSKQRRS